MLQVPRCRIQQRRWHRPGGKNRGRGASRTSSRRRGPLGWSSLSRRQVAGCDCARWALWCGSHVPVRKQMPRSAHAMNTTAATTPDRLRRCCRLWCCCCCCLRSLPAAFLWALGLTGQPVPQNQIRISFYVARHACASCAKKFHAFQSPIKLVPDIWV